LAAFYLGYIMGIGNQKQTFGDTGLPKNCRALISANITGVAEGRYTAADALGSIDRNCGMYGLIWGER